MKLSISSKITLTGLVLAIIIIAVCFVVITNIVRSNLEKEITGRLSVEAPAQMEKVDMFFNERLADLKFITAGTSQLTETSRSVEIKMARMRELEKDSKAYAEISLYDVNGIRIGDTRSLGIGLNESEKPFIREALNGHIFYDPTPLMSESLGKLVMHFSAPLYYANGSIYEVVVTRVDMNKIADVIGGSTGNEFDIDLYDREGNPIYSSSHGTGGSADESDAAFLSKAASSKSGIDTTTRMHNGQETISVGVLEKGYLDYGSNGWVLVLNAPTQDVLAPLYELEGQLALIAAFALIACALGAYFLAREISRPIKQLHAATLELQKGNYEARTDIRTKDELEDLGKTFNETVERLAKIEEEHAQLDKAKTEFMSITSHELRSPMTPMKAQLQMLLENYFGKLTPKQRESTETVLRNTERLDKIILDFLEISRIEAARLKFKFVRTDVTSYIKELAADIQNGFMPEKKVKIEVRLEKMPEFEVDPDRVVQVLRNLLTNAVKFSPQGGKVIVSARQIDDHIRFDVQDFGTGMDVSTQGRVFEPFFQAESAMSRQFGGTGLGLAICKGIVESQNGRIWFESEPGKGTTFHFTVPLEPVREVKPIRVLLSKKVESEKRIKEIFVSYLGPLGKKEFETFRAQHELNTESFSAYVQELGDKKIIGSDALRQMEADLHVALGKNEKDINDSAKP
jgi:signal transduction histidine kinase